MRHHPTWSWNRKLLYASKFFHMVLVNMCQGGIFEIFLFAMSRGEHTVSSLVWTGENATSCVRPDLDAHLPYDLEFFMKLHAEEHVPCPDTERCFRTLFCMEMDVLTVSMLCENGTHFLLSSSEDEVGFHPLGTCKSTVDLQRSMWHNVKLEVTDKYGAEDVSSRSGFAVLVYVNSTKVCEVSQIAHATMPNAIQGPRGPLHKLNNAEIKDVVYKGPPSTYFVGRINTLQGLLAVALAYPLGLLGDCMNRYTLLRINVFVGLVAGVFLICSVLMKLQSMMYIGIVFFTFYQQCMTALISAALADNALRNARTQAGANVKTFSALAMSVGPAVQMTVILCSGTDQWSPSMVRLLLLPGWFLLPVIGLCTCVMVPVGKKCGQVPNTDEVDPASGSQQGVRCLDDAWLDQVMFFGFRRRFIVASSASVFFFGTLMANGMTSRFYSLYFMRELRFSPLAWCGLNVACRLGVAMFTQVVKPLSPLIGRMNLAVALHLTAVLSTLGVYGGGIFEPTISFSCASYMMRWAALQGRDPLLYAMTMDTVPLEQRSRWASVATSSTYSFSASAVVGGYLADLYGYEFSFAATAASILATILLLLPGWLVFPKSEGPCGQAIPSACTIKDDI